MFDYKSRETLDEEDADDKEVEETAKKIFNKHKAAFEELTKGENKKDYLKTEDEIFKDMSLEEIYDKSKEHWENKE